MQGVSLPAEFEKHGNFPANEQILESGLTVVNSWEVENALLRAVSNGSVALVKRLIELGASVEARDATGSTALMIAAQTKQASILQPLIALGVLW